MHTLLTTQQWLMRKFPSLCNPLKCHQNTINRAVSSFVAVFQTSNNVGRVYGGLTGLASIHSFGGSIRLYDCRVKIRQTIRNIRNYRLIGRFLLARMLYIDGLNTLFAFGGIYAAGTFGMELADVITFGILLNVTGGIGAFAFAWLDDWIGPKRVIMIALVGLMILGLTAVLTTSVTVFWIVGGLLGLFVGPTQAASRTLMTKIAPEAQQTEMFGLYALSGKVTAFLGPLVLSTVTDWTDSQRAGMATILIFFVAGFFVLASLKTPSLSGGA